jgi:hypothetical protein
MPFPASLVQVEGEPGSRRTWVEGLEDVLTRCYQRDALPSELGDVAWSAPGREISVPEWQAGPVNGAPAPSVTTFTNKSFESAPPRVATAR